ncbi:TerD family protein [Streptomyces pharetrae]|uniref:TerD family protein n=1 Tax=Streptomyces pharetrae TaxID=291370 RepID=UPI003347E188
MLELAKGGNTTIGPGPVTVELCVEGDTVDLSALLVTANGKVRSDDDLVFYNQPSAESGAVRHLAAKVGSLERIEVDTAALPADVDRVVLVASCDPDDTSRTFRNVNNVHVSARASGDTVLFRLPVLTGGERAVLLTELYRRGADWKLRAIGQGYANGLAGLATDFGIEVAEDEALEPPTGHPTPLAVPDPIPIAALPTPRARFLKPPLGRISLDKGSQVSLSLDKADRELVVTAALEWDGGSEQRRRRGADLDLYALFIPGSKALRGTMPPGTLVKSGHVPQGEPLRVGGTVTSALPVAPKKGKKADVVYYRRLGSLTSRPYIRLDGDSRLPGREAVQIVRPDEQGYVLLCAYSALSNGFGSFRSFGAKVVIDDGRDSTVTVPLYENTKTRYWVAIALVDFTAADRASIRHVEAYSARMTERRPVLHADGTIEMNAGPVEFKRR